MVDVNPEPLASLDETSAVNTGAVRSSRLTIALLVMLAVAIVLVMVLTHRLIASDRARLVDDFAMHRREHIEIVAREIGENLDDVLHDLAFAGPLLAAAKDETERRRVLETLVGSDRGYSVAVLVDEGAEPIWAEALRGNRVSEPLSQQILATTEALLDAEDPGLIEVSHAVERQADHHSLRVFAMRFSTVTGRREALGLLVDIETFLEPLRLVASDPQTHLLVIDPRNLPSPASDPTLARAYREGRHPELMELTRRGAGGTAGTAKFSARGDATLSALGSDEFIAAHASIESNAGGKWSFVTLTPLTQIRAHEEQILLRLYTVALVIVFMLATFGTYVVLSSRRRTVLRERLRSAWAIAHLNEKADKILESLPAGVMVVSAEGRITDVNHPIGERDETDLVGRELAEAFAAASEATRIEIAEIFEKARASGRPQRIAGQGVRVFGGDRHYAVHAVPLQTGSSDAAALLVFEDITAIRELENQLLHAEKLATVGELSAGIAHEVGTPLGVARGRAEFLVEKLDETDPRRKHANIVIEQIDLVRRIIEGLLDFSRMSPAAQRATPLGEVVAEVEELLRFELGRAELRIDKRIPDDLPPVAADPDQLRQVVTNILTNARDASPPGATITVRATTTDGDAVTFEVQDEGSGIPESHQHRVFDPFFTTKKRGMGTGLGLWVVVQIVKNHGAQVEIEGAEGGGTLVRVTWPIARCESGDAELLHVD